MIMSSAIVVGMISFIWFFMFDGWRGFFQFLDKLEERKNRNSKCVCPSLNEAAKILNNVDIEQFSEEELLEIEDQLNVWLWPQQLGKEPECWTRMPDFDRRKWYQRICNHYIPSRFDAARAILSRIHRKLGDRKILRYHWLHNLGRTEEEFNEWYGFEHEHNLFL